MTYDKQAEHNHLAVETVLDKWRQAVNRSDLQGIADCYSNDILAFDAAQTLEFPGKAAYMQHWENCLVMMGSNHNFNITTRQQFVDHRSAFVSGLAYCSCTTEDGQEQGAWTRFTQTLLCTDGEWAIVHEHFSMPFDMATGKALMELQPENLVD
jgi:ketosteroid isomerase-like protein